MLLKMPSLVALIPLSAVKWCQQDSPFPRTVELRDHSFFERIAVAGKFPHIRQQDRPYLYVTPADQSDLKSLAGECVGAPAQAGHLCQQDQVVNG